MENGLYRFYTGLGRFRSKLLDRTNVVIEDENSETEEDDTETDEDDVETEEDDINLSALSIGELTGPLMFCVCLLGIASLLLLIEILIFKFYTRLQQKTEVL